MVLLMSGCAAQVPAGRSSAAAVEISTALTCKLPTNCVNSLGGSSLGPLRYEGNSTQALALLRATLADFPEAQIVNTDGLSLEVVFTTPMGFKDTVDFRVDTQAQRIDYRSRSSFGLFDFGKNRSRMTAISDRFEQNVRR
jgi:uncharacterized protein (DUF1499 family)